MARAAAHQTGRWKTRVLLGIVGGLMGLGAALPAAQQAPAAGTPYVPRQNDRPEPVEGDEPGFQPIFDGKTLNGWTGDPVYWRVEDGSLVGEITPETIVKRNTFIVWQGGTPRDFELKLEYRITEAGNSGINYRSSMLPASPETKFPMRGYQFDIDGRRQYVGNNYEERGRLFLAVRGQVTRVVSGRKPVLVSTIGDTAELANAATDDWNTVHIMARGNTLTQLLNGRLMSITIDDDAPNRPAEGLIGVQVHVGPPMKVEYRNIRLKTW